MRSGPRIMLATFVALVGTWAAPRVDAACHSFSVKTNSPVTEGEPVKVTVTRDNNLDESSVQVQTANATAVAPADYDSTIVRVEFTDETSRTIEIDTNEDKIGEETETFHVKLNSARGCRTQNTDYQYGAPATVTIKDDDGDVVPTLKPTAEPTSRPTSTARASSTPKASPSGSPTAEPTENPTPEPEESAIALPTPEPDDDGLEPWLVAVAIGALVVAAVGALIATRVRRGHEI